MTWQVIVSFIVGFCLGSGLSSVAYVRAFKKGAPKP